MVHQADYVVPVEIENQYHNVYVIKRPGVDGAPTRPWRPRCRSRADWPSLTQAS